MNGVGEIPIHLERSPKEHASFKQQEVPIERTPLEKSSNETHTSDDEDFPVFITTGKWKAGSVIIAFLIGIYCFTFLALICDGFFLPCIERICEALNLSHDVAAATFMATATSTPEFFVNIIGTFITESDIGVGTVIGSSLFNTLGVAALGSLAASKPIQVDWWPVTRDCSIYLVSITVLVFLVWDSCIYWFEGLVLFIIYFLYFVIMYNNKRISEAVRKLVKTTRCEHDEKAVENVVVVEKPTLSTIYTIEEPIQYYKENKEEGSITVSRRSCSYYILKLWSIIICPLKILLRCTIPNPVTWPKLFPLTFFICIIFIGLNSYVVSWMISIIGHALHVPDVVLGLTFLAAGSSLPEAVSIVIMSRKGNGRMGISNALGANSMNILLSLGFPWFIKALILSKNGDTNNFIDLQSGSINYIIIGLILVVLSLFFILYCNKFILSTRTGVILIIFYLIAVCAAISSEIFLETPITS